MFWEIIATVVAGFLAAGLVLPLRFYKKTPKWLVPIAAGLGMMAFQVYSEYTWFLHTSSKLPEGSVVVASVSKSTWFRPWSYVYPQTFWFVALDKNSVQPTGVAHRYQGQVYFFERRMPIQVLGVQIDCQTKQHAYMLNNAPLVWQSQEQTQVLLTSVCP